MNFGSKFVYNYSDSEEELVSDDEFDEGMTKVHSDSDDDDKKNALVSDSAAFVTAASLPVEKSVHQTSPSSAKEQRKSAGFFGRLFKSSKEESPPPRPPPRSSNKKSRKQHHWVADSAVFNEQCQQKPAQGKKWRRADTNVISVNFDTLKKPSNMHTGDPFYCSDCGVVLSKLSKLVPAEDGNRSWNCEFCGAHNLVDLVDEEIPHSDDVTFLVNPARCTVGGGRSGADESLIIFCMDTSGSMCVTTEVPGTVNLRGSRLERLQSMNDTGESQYLPRQRKNVTYVSRLQGVQVAVDHQLEEMLKEHSSRRVALITFNSEVISIGDGTSDPVHVTGDKLSNKEELLKVGSELKLPNHISQTRHKLGDRIFDLEEGGQTALGPALIISIAMACQVPGSKVIICTDGMSNVGLGNLDKLGTTDEAYEQASEFFEDVSGMANAKGVAVSVISIKGTDCKMVELGRVAEATGGQVNIVDPLKLTQEFGNILADPIIATNVSATLQLHRGLYFRHEESEESKVTKFVGNVTKQSEVSFEYGVRRQAHKKGGAKKAKIEGQVSEQIPHETQKQEVVYDNPRSGSPMVYDVPRNDPVPFENLSIPVQVSSEGDVVYDNHGNATSQQAVPTAIESADVEGAIQSRGNTTKPETDGPVAMETGKREVDSPIAMVTDASVGGEGGAGAAGGSKEQTLLGDISELPFQLCIKYLDLDGAEALRVITQTKPITRDRIQAENEMNMEAIGAHACQKSAAMALKGDYTPSRLNAFMYQRLLHRKAAVNQNEEEQGVYDNFYANALPMENRINSMQLSERRRCGVTYSDDSDSEDDHLKVAAAAVPKKKLKAKALPKPKSMQRRIECDDTSAQIFYNNVKVNSKGFNKKK